MGKNTSLPMADNSKTTGMFQRIEAVIQLIPKGQISSYGDIAAFTGGVTPRHVGFALAASDGRLPWHRVVNAQGAVSLRGSDAMARQYELLVREGIEFNEQDEIDWRVFGWEGPPLDWFIDQGREVEEAIALLSKITTRHEKQSKNYSK